MKASRNFRQAISHPKYILRKMKKILYLILVSLLLVSLSLLIRQQDYKTLLNAKNWITRSNKVKKVKFPDTKIKFKEKRKICSLLPIGNQFSDLRNKLNLTDFENMYELPNIGGEFEPADCQSNRAVAVIVPYRNKEKSLKYFAQYMHHFLQLQRIKYRMYIIEQFGDGLFNRAKLLNVGFAESGLNFNCYIFHDVDLLPLNKYNLYRCSDKPRHLSVSVDTLEHKLPYWGIFGGAVAVTKEHMERTNGFTNNFWGWGTEDDEFTLRLRYQNLSITRYPIEIGNYMMLKHRQEHDKTSVNFIKLSNTKYRYKSDGISTLEYKVLRRKNEKLFTRITVDLLR